MAMANPPITAPLQYLYPHPHHQTPEKTAMKALAVGKIKERFFTGLVYCANNTFLLIRRKVLLYFKNKVNQVKLSEFSFSKL